MMRQLNKIIHFVIQQRLLSLAVILLSLIIVVSGSLKKNAWQEDTIVQSDVISYYAYLPAVWIYHDMSFSFLDNYKDESIKGMRIWTEQNEHGKKFSKMTAGESVLLSPFFLVAHQVAKSKGEVANGYSPTYYFSIVVAAWCYFLLGLLLIRSMLYRFKMNELITAVTLLCLTLGTNLIYYASIEVGMSHIYSFFLFAAGFWATIKWHDKPTWANSLFLGGILGLIVITRIPNAIFLIVPVAYGVHSFDSLKAKWQHLKVNFGKLALVVVMFILTCFIQPALWFWGTGEWLVYSYSDEGFFFFDPHVIDVLFSFRKGLFIYVPILFISFFGILLLKRRAENLLLPITLFTIINIYVLSSWWCWWFGGGLGNRAFIDSYALFALPLALGLDWIRKNLTIISLFSLVGVTLGFNFFIMDKYLDGVLHFDSMTKESFYAMFNKGYEKNSYWGKMAQPSYANRVIGGDENEPLTENLVSATDSLLSPNEFPFTPYESTGLDYYTTKYQTKLKLKGELILPEHIDSSQTVSVVLDIRDPKFVNSIQYSTIDFTADSLLTGRRKNFTKLIETPRVWGDNIKVKIYIWNTTNRAVQLNSFLATKLIY